MDNFMHCKAYLCCICYYPKSYLEGLVPKEVDLLKAIVLYVLQAVRLVPSLGEDIEGDLPTNRILEAIILELLREGEAEQGG